MSRLTPTDNLDALRKMLASTVREAVRLELNTLEEKIRSEALLTKTKTADQLNVSERTVDTLIASGELQPVRIRGCVRVHPKTLQAFIRRHAGEGRA